MELDAKRFGLAGGIVWGLGVAFTVLLTMFFDIGGSFIQVLGSVYVGLEVSLLGLILGFIYGFIDAFIGLFLIAWIYNKLA